MPDTNILVSAALFPNSVTAAAYMKAVAPPHKSVVCDYAMEELRRVFNEKFPRRIPDYEKFVSIMALTVEIVYTPPEEEQAKDEGKVRDAKDRPILRAALAAKVDVLITGDKDFWESGIATPQTLSAAEFLKIE
jgi:putative PIN family toxin of toxin-antitoxin system